MHEPMITMIVGTMVLPSPRDAAIVLSMKAETIYDKAIILIRFSPASMTTSLEVKILKNSFPKRRRRIPRMAPKQNE